MSIHTVDNKNIAPDINVFSGYGWLRGFNMVPSWGARIEDAWWFYNAQEMRSEVSLAKQVHANCIRLWIEFSAWMRDPDKITEYFLDAVSAIGEAEMKVMPCLFNRWHDVRFDYGGTYAENLFGKWEQYMDYVRAIVTPLSADDRILVWDLCNEPQALDLLSPLNRAEHSWLEFIAQTIRSCNVRQPITIGTWLGSNIDLYAPFVDVLCAHPYAHTVSDLAELVSAFDFQRKQAGKTLLVNECIPGCFDDCERAKLIKCYTEILSSSDMGWMGWALREGKAISTRRDRYDGNGINGEGFHVFFTKNGKLRRDLDFLTEQPALLPPWKKKL